MIGHTIMGVLPAFRRTAVSVFAAAALLRPVVCLAQASLPTHLANPADPLDLAVLRANGDQIDRGTIRNSCSTVVHPVISYPASGVAVEVEEDTAGTCSGSNPPSTLTVLTKTGPIWRVGTSTTGNSFRLGPVHAGYPEILVQYPPFQKDCPALGWKGQTYAMIQPCAGGRGQ